MQVALVGALSFPRGGANCCAPPRLRTLLGKREMAPLEQLTCEHQMTESPCRPRSYVTGSKERVLMLRRLSTLLLVWVGLLGAALPAFACSMAALDRDCCPQNAPSSCGDGSRECLQAAAAICRASTSGAAQAVSIQASQLLQEGQAGPGGSPDLPVLPAWVLSSMDSAPWDDIPEPVSSPPRTDAALTYLHTGRLRL